MNSKVFPISCVRCLSCSARSFDPIDLSIGKYAILITSFRYNYTKNPRIKRAGALGKKVTAYKSGSVFFVPASERAVSIIS